MERISTDNLKKTYHIKSKKLNKFDEKKRKLLADIDVIISEIEHFNNSLLARGEGGNRDNDEHKELSFNQVKERIESRVAKKQTREDSLKTIEDQSKELRDKIKEICLVFVERGIEINAQEPINCATMKEKLNYFSKVLVDNTNLMEAYNKDLISCKEEIPDNFNQIRYLQEGFMYDDDFHRIAEHIHKVIVLYLCSIEKNPFYYLSTINQSTEKNYFDYTKYRYVFDKKNGINIQGGVAKYDEEYRKFTKSPYLFLFNKVSNADLKVYLEYHGDYLITKIFTMEYYQNCKLDISLFRTYMDKFEGIKYNLYRENLERLEFLEKNVRPIQKRLKNYEEEYARKQRDILDTRDKCLEMLITPKMTNYQANAMIKIRNDYEDRKTKLDQEYLYKISEQNNELINTREEIITLKSLL